MIRNRIIREIKRLAEQDGKTPGSRYFAKVTQISNINWTGRYWAKWSDALVEAGFAPNEKNKAIELDVLMESFLSLTQELNKVPSQTEMMLKANSAPDIPSYSTFFRRFGSKSGLLRQAIKYAQSKKFPDQIINILMENYCEPRNNGSTSAEYNEIQTGYVYLMKSGRHYKIGYTNSPDRRRYEIGLQLPEGIESVHSIETDDPSGIEVYWHNRFKEKRLNGEWFDLSPGDVRIFRKRKFM